MKRSLLPSKGKVNSAGTIYLSLLPPLITKGKFTRELDSKIPRYTLLDSIL